MNDPALSYELTFEERDGYLYAYVKAETTSEEIAMSYLHKIADRCAAIGCKRLMYHRDIPVMLDNITLFFVTNAFAEWARDVRVAVINPYPSLADAMEFSMLLTVNVGAFDHVFDNIPDAEAWLLT